MIRAAARPLSAPPSQTAAPLVAKSAPGRRPNRPSRRERAAAADGSPGSTAAPPPPAGRPPAIAPAVAQVLVPGANSCPLLDLQGAGMESQQQEQQQGYQPQTEQQQGVQQQAPRRAEPELEGPPPALDLTPPDTRHVFVVRDFLPEAKQLRQHYDEKMVLDPLRPPAARARWDSILGPGRFRLMRTQAEPFFGASLAGRLRSALARYGERVLGCSGVSPILLSYYINNCRHGWHCAAPRGPFSFVLSLTRWEERTFGGGEIMLLSPSAFETDEVTLIDPLFNQLVVFDTAVPHGVTEVTGVDDPLEARVVLQGWFTEPGRLICGSLGEAEAGPELDACVADVRSAIAHLDLPPVSGTAVVRLHVSGSTGRVEGLTWLVNTLVAPPPLSSRSGRSPAPWAVTDAVLTAIGERCAAVRLPPSGDGGATSITLPFVFS